MKQGQLGKEKLPIPLRLRCRRELGVEVLFELVNMELELPKAHQLLLFLLLICKTHAPERSHYLTLVIHDVPLFLLLAPSTASPSGTNLAILQLRGSYHTVDARLSGLAYLGTAQEVLGRVSNGPVDKPIDVVAIQHLILVESSYVELLRVFGPIEYLGVHDLLEETWVLFLQVHILALLQGYDRF
jgi:hypothetical protein